MSFQHPQLAGGRWQELSLAEQLANAGSEVSRALNWQKKHKPDRVQQAFTRALELVDLTARDTRNLSSLKELRRLRECLADYFSGSNQFGSTETAWRKYFDAFALLARKNK